MKQYKLLKDWPIYRSTSQLFCESAGSILSQFHRNPGPLPEAFYESEEQTVFAADLVENNPEWFEEVEEPEFTRKDMIEFAKYARSKDFCATSFGFYLKNWLKENKHGKTE